MKKYTFAAAAFLLAGIFGAAACNNGKEGGKENPPQPIITVVANEQSVSITDAEVNGYDYTPLFTITQDGAGVDVLASYIDSSLVLEQAGEYTVSCSYGGQSASLAVVVTESVSPPAPVYEITLSVEEITLTAAAVNGYDFNALFTLTVDGVERDITEDMVTTDVKAAVGEYFYTVTAADASKTLKVIVGKEHEVVVIPSYRQINIPVNELEGFDFTSLFSVYVDGFAVRVETGMIDISRLTGIQVGGSARVSMTYTAGNDSAAAEVTVIVTEESRVVVNIKNAVTYPNGDDIDLTSLFEIFNGGEKIAVTEDMISGAVDYSAAGINEITLNYGGERYVATVEVKLGVVINHTNGDTVVVLKGTDAGAYRFAEDFTVLINGIRFTYIEPYIDVSEVNFSEVGTYTAKITIPYNEKNLSLSGGTSFTYAEETITYVVKDNSFTVEYGRETVELPTGTESYNVLDNLTVKIRGKVQQLVDNKDWVDTVSCYYEILSDPIDFTSAGAQQVRVALYVNGVDAEPYIAEYEVVIRSDIEITVNDTAVFTGSTLFAVDLFTVTENGVAAEIAYDMLEGKVDTFRAGVYVVMLDYKGATAEARVVVFDDSMLGTYFTMQTTIPELPEEEDDGGEYGDYGDYGSGEYSLSAADGVQKLGDTVISRDGIVVNGVRAARIRGVDENTMIVTLNSYDYTLSYDNGIVVLNPDNSVKLGFNEAKRPLVYFSEDKFSDGGAVTVNYSDAHVLQTNFLAYSIDAFRVIPKDGGAPLWYALMINLVEKTSSDTIYDVCWGTAEFAPAFAPAAGVVSSLKFDGREYSFTMTDKTVGKVNKNASLKLYANMTFRGTVGGKNAELRVDGAERYTLVVGTETLFSGYGSPYDLVNTMNNGGANYAEHTININSYRGESGVFSYKFDIDTEKLTFRLLDRDLYFGKYETQGKYIFLDGYGEGVISFDTSGFSKTQFIYTVNANMLQIEYINVSSAFAYGAGATFYIDPLLNVLTAKRFAGGEGIKFENTVLTDGAIVRVSNYTVGADSDAIAKAKIRSGIEVITRDGVWDEKTKQERINLRKVNCGTRGFYQFTVTVTVGGREVESYYAVQILEAVYAGNPVVGTYGSGVINRSYSLSVDKYGQASVNCLGTVFTGTAEIAADGSFRIKAHNQAAGTITASGALVSEGLVSLKCTGAVNFTDYFTTGTAKTAGTAGCVLRQIAVNGNYVYLLSATASAAGERVTVETVEGDVTQAGAKIIIKCADGRDIHAEIVSWNSADNGLRLT